MLGEDPSYVGGAALVLAYIAGPSRASTNNHSYTPLCSFNREYWIRVAEVCKPWSKYVITCCAFFLMHHRVVRSLSFCGTISVKNKSEAPVNVASQ